MTSLNSSEDYINETQKNQKRGRSLSNQSAETKSSAGPAFVLVWMWNWFAALPKTVTNLYADFKSGELLSRFALLDAMCQFIVAVATSCHPQEEPLQSPDDDERGSNPNSPSKKHEIKVFQGTARTLRPRTVDSN